LTKYLVKLCWKSWFCKIIDYCPFSWWRLRQFYWLKHCSVRFLNFLIKTTISIQQCLTVSSMISSSSLYSIYLSFKILNKRSTLKIFVSLTSIKILLVLSEELEFRSITWVLLFSFWITRGSTETGIFSSNKKIL
jgi:hypothetical protein